MLKYAFTLSFFILFFAALSSSAQEKRKTETITIKTQINCDHCKQCESCGGRFDREIPFIKGVKDYSFDEKAMTLTLRYNTKQITPEKLREAISNIGFDADDVKANPEAVAKLDYCCRKGS